MLPNLLLIHGAWSTRNSFNHIVASVPHQTVVYCDYDSNKNDLESIALNGYYELSDNRTIGNFIVVGHSIGGLVALALSQHPKVTKTFTLASPITGCSNLNWFVQNFISLKAPILNELIPSKPFMKLIHNQDYSTNPIEVIVATDGFNPMYPSHIQTDGVVSIESQIAWTPKNSIITEIPTNHAEILQHPTVIERIQNAL